MTRFYYEADYHYDTADHNGDLIETAVWPTWSIIKVVREAAKALVSCYKRGFIDENGVVLEKGECLLRNSINGNVGDNLYIIIEQYIVDEDNYAGCGTAPRLTLHNLHDFDPQWNWGIKQVWLKDGKPVVVNVPEPKFTR